MKIVFSKIKFIILPYEFQTRNKCKNELLKPQKKVKNILYKNKFLVLDLTSEFCNFEKPKKLFLNFDPVHLSTTGHDLVFKSLNSKLK